MIIVSVEFLNPECRILPHSGIEDFSEFKEYVGLQYLPAVFGAPDYVVLMLVG